MVAIATAPHRRPSPPSRPVLVVLPPVTRPAARTFRRRRLGVLLAALALLVLPALALAASGAERSAVVPASTPTAPAAPPARSVYVVQPGDTLWSIAHKLEPGADPRDVVDHLVDLNGSGALQPGQRLRLTNS